MGMFKRISISVMFFFPYSIYSKMTIYTCYCCLCTPYPCRYTWVLALLYKWFCTWSVTLQYLAFTDFCPDVCGSYHHFYCLTIILDSMPLSQCYSMSLKSLAMIPSPILALSHDLWMISCASSVTTGAPLENRRISAQVSHKWRLSLAVKLIELTVGQILNISTCGCSSGEASGYALA